MRKSDSGTVPADFSGSGFFFGWTVLAAFCLLIGGCEKAEDRVQFEGQNFRAKASKSKGADRESFVVVVSGASRNFEGARQAGRFEATRYCVSNFGTSDVDWESGPDDDADSLEIVRDRLTFRGRCFF